MGLFNRKEKEKYEEINIPSAEQIIKCAESLRQDPRNPESELPEIISAFYSATQNIELDESYIREVLNSNKTENENTNDIL